MKLLKITVNMTPADFADFMYDFDNEEVKTKMFELDDSTATIDVEYDGKFVAFGILSELQHSQLIKLYDATGLGYTVEDLTNEALHSFYATKNESVKFALDNNWKMKGLIDKFVDDYAIVDDMLDKISKYGMVSLNEHDHRILKSI